MPPPGSGALPALPAMPVSARTGDQFIVGRPRAVAVDGDGDHGRRNRSSRRRADDARRHEDQRPDRIRRHGGPAAGAATRENSSHRRIRGRPPARQLLPAARPHRRRRQVHDAGLRAREIFPAHRRLARRLDAEVGDAQRRRRRGYSVRADQQGRRQRRRHVYRSHFAVERHGPADRRQQRPAGHHRDRVPRRRPGLDELRLQLATDAIDAAVRRTDRSDSARCRPATTTRLRFQTSAPPSGRIRSSSRR